MIKKIAKFIIKKIVGKIAETGVKIIISQIAVPVPGVGLILIVSDIVKIVRIIINK